MITKGIPILISHTDLFKYISQWDMVSRYVSNFHKIDVSFKSEFRSDDSDPSSRIYIGDKGDLMFKDFGDPSIPKAMNIISYVSFKYNIEYQAAINKIAVDFGLITTQNGETLITVKNNKGKIKKEQFKAPSDLIIKIKKRDWTKRDIAYWNSYNISIKLLERNNIKSISHVFYGDCTYHTEFSKDHLVYSYDYYWSKNIFRRKIYQPESIDFKWRTNCDWTIVQNYPNIPKEGGKLLFIQSSYKDCMVMEQLGYYAIAPNKEGSWIPDYYWDKIKERWKTIIIYWDNDWHKADNPGLTYAKHFSELYNVPYILNPDNEPGDISDYIKYHGIHNSKELVKNLIDKI